MARIPNLFIIGAMKSGTSSLYNYLSMHPEIYMAENKEPMHFSREENWSLGNEEYLKLFALAQDEKYVGEGSTEYSKRPFREGVAQRLFDFNANSRIIYIIREPFARIVSQYKHMVKFKSETKGLVEAVTSLSADYMTNSYYAYQLEPYIELFGRKSIFTASFEKMTSFPHEFLKNLFNWLDVDESYIPPNLGKAFHVSPVKYQEIDDKSTLVGYAMKLYKLPGIKKWIPEGLKASVKNVLPKKEEIDFASHEFIKEVNATRAVINPILRSWNTELESLTGLSFSMWRDTLHELEYEGANANLTKKINAQINASLRR